MEVVVTLMMVAVLHLLTFNFLILSITKTMKRLLILYFVAMATIANAQGSSEKNVMAMTALTPLAVPTSRIITTIATNNSGYISVASLLGESTTSVPATIVGTLPSTGNSVYAGKLIIENFVSGSNEVINCFVDKTGKRWALPNGSTTNLLSSSTNTMSSTVNGVAATAPIINTHTFTSASSALTVGANGVNATITPATGTIATTLGFNSSGVLVKEIISGGGGGTTITTYSAGNGAMVTATGAGVTFTRASAGAWTLAIPANVKVLSYKIYSTSGEFPGTNVTITYDYTSNTTTNQSVVTQDPPVTELWGDASSSWIPYTSGGALTANWRSSITSVGSGDIVVL